MTVARRSLKPGSTPQASQACQKGCLRINRGDGSTSNHVCDDPQSTTSLILEEGRYVGDSGLTIF
ncbi:hypothetical protein BDZ94DRAFT_1245566 [Collybia nuda]|uniref:Uncharacterized protein n=1 Tax=Collybia nuda TaxID=64659 RepID=A0A9P5YH46_9AGAR|nr:hypothetical protein BDZ94DRAFT_1245566 [Collybia nuda]